MFGAKAWVNKWGKEPQPAETFAEDKGKMESAVEEGSCRTGTIMSITS